MKEKQLILVSFKPERGKYTPSIPLSQFLTSEKDVETVLNKVTSLYQKSIDSMKEIIKEIENYRATRKPLPARIIWRLGDQIFRLVEDLNKEGFQLDGVYEHLSRDLNAKRKWLEKVIILRRYIPKQNLIPETLNWGRCEKGTRRIAENISRGILPK